MDREDDRVPDGNDGEEREEAASTSGSRSTWSIRAISTGSTGRKPMLRSKSHSPDRFNGQSRRDRASGSASGEDVGVGSLDRRIDPHESGPGERHAAGDRLGVADLEVREHDLADDAVATAPFHASHPHRVADALARGVEELAPERRPRRESRAERPATPTGSIEPFNEVNDQPVTG